MTQRERLLVGLLGLIAFGLRYLYVSQSEASPFFDFPQVDAKTYTQAATQMAVDGHWRGDPTPFWQPPLYPYFLGLVFALFGPDYYIARLVQAVLGSANCVLIYFLGRRIFSSAVGFAAAGLAAIYGPLIFFDAEFLPPVLAVFLDLLLLLSLLWAASGGYLRLLVPGVLFGLAALCVANILLFLPFAFGWLLWRDANLSWKQRLLHTFPLLLGALLVIAPVSLRNYLVGNDWVLISSNAGINFFIGNNADYHKTVSIQPGPEWRKLVARPKSEAGLDRASQKSRFFFSRAWEFIRTHPLDYGRLLLDKIYLFWHGHEVGRNQDLYYARNFSSLLSMLLWKSFIAFPFGVLAPLALLGIGLLWREGLQPQTGLCSPPALSALLCSLGRPLLRNSALSPTRRADLAPVRRPWRQAVLLPCARAADASSYRRVHRRCGPVGSEQFPGGGHGGGCRDPLSAGHGISAARPARQRHRGLPPSSRSRFDSA